MAVDCAEAVMPQMNNTGQISLKIYNISGQIVKTLVNEYRPGGEYTRHWDGSDDAGKLVSSGIYLCNLQAGNYQTMQKMTLIRQCVNRLSIDD